jgi:DNA invertase Pin-like site-specific DNA recombinase
MFECAERHEFDVLVFWSLDRLTREGVLPTLQHLDRLAKVGVGYASVMEQHLDTANPFNDVFIAFAASTAKQEKVRISDRTKAGLARVRATGIRLGRPERVFDIEKARALRREGRSYRYIARTLNVSLGTLHARVAA